MTTYDFRIEPRKSTVKQRAIAGLIVGSVYFAVSLLWRALSTSSATRHQGLISLAIESAVMSLVVSGSLFARRYRTLKGTILVTADRMTELIEAPWWRGTYRRSVRRGKVRSIVVIGAYPGRAGGIGVSENSKLRARLTSGFLFLPDTLPEFATLKFLVESWREV